MDLSFLYNASLWVVPVVFAVTMHEAAHGWMAERFGDDTARKLGRVTFNPIKHIDRNGTIILPALLYLVHSPILFGYAKPVPVNFYRLHPARLGTVAVALAGPGMNILLATISALLLHLWPLPTSDQDITWFQLNLFHALMVNVVLALFNMLPILPLDGGRVLGALLPEPWADRYAKTERYGMLIVMVSLLLPGLLHFPFLPELLGSMAEWAIRMILILTGNGAYADIDG